MENKELITKEDESLIKKAERYANVEKIIISTHAEYENSVKECRAIKTVIDELEEARKARSKPHWDKQKAINTKFNDVKDMVKNGEKVHKAAMKKWNAEVERKKIELQKKEAAKAEEARRKAEVKKQKELDKVEKYRSEGKDLLADNALARAETYEDISNNTVAPVPTDDKPKGVYYRTDWVCEVKDLRKAVMYCLDNPNLQELIQLDIKGIQKLVGTTNGMFTVPGIINRKEENPVIKKIT